MNQTSNAALYGKGVFTTVSIAEGEPFLWDKHWARLLRDAAAIGMGISSFDELAVLTELRRKITLAGAVSRVRITFYDRTQSSIWNTDGVLEAGAEVAIVVGGKRPLPDQIVLGISPYLVNTTSPLAGIKSLNYLEPLAAFEEASRRVCSEAVRLNERGEIVSACLANVFWERGGRLFTPSLSTGCLPGTTREYILENLECEVVESGLEAMHDAERIFLSSAGLGIVAVARFEGRSKDVSAHPILELLKAHLPRK